MAHLDCPKWRRTPIAVAVTAVVIAGGWPKATVAEPLQAPTVAGGGLLTFVCSEPTGVTVAKTPGKPLQQLSDGFSGVRPRFVFDRNRPSELLVLWGNAAITGVPSNETAEKTTVLQASAEKIVAVSIAAHSLWVYELRAIDGLGLFTRHVDSEVPGLFPPRASVFSADCQVSSGR